MRPQLRMDLGDDMSRGLAHDVDVLARSITALVRERGGTLVALTVGAAPDTDHRELEHLLEARLARGGLDFVDVEVTPVEGPMRVLSAEFER